MAYGTCVRCGKYTECVVSHKDAAHEMVLHMHEGDHCFEGDVSTKPITNKGVKNGSRT